MIHTARQTGKFIALKRRLRVMFPELPIAAETIAVGILERLWHLTIVSAQRGDIGVLDDETIADAVGWYGDPKLLVELLCETHWLDRSDAYRLVVHGWSDHCPGFIRKNIARKNGFVDANGPIEHASLTKAAQVSQEAGTPNPTQPNPIKPTPPSAAVSAGVPDSTARPPGGREGLVVELLARGVKESNAIVDRACGNQCSIELIYQVVEHYEAMRPAYNPGALYRRIEKLRPGQDVATLWCSKPSAEYTRQQATTKAEEQRTLQAKEDAEDAAAAEDAAEHYADLDREHGDQLNNLSHKEVMALIQQTGNPRYYLRSYNRNQFGNPLLRELLLELLATNPTAEAPA